MTDGTIPVSVAIPVRNEERNLAKCLDRLGRFDEVVVIDSGSEDRTRDIARSHGATVLNFHWNGTYPKKRNWALLNHSFSYQWVLFLDADEMVTQAFCDEVSAAINENKYNGYWLNYTNYFLGKPLRYGEPQRKLALFRIGSALYERIDESDWSILDMEVHEHPIVNGDVGVIRAPIDHRDYQGLAKFIDRHKEYARWEAQRTGALRSGERKSWDSLTQRQRIKYSNIDRWWFAWAYFAYAYIWRYGFLDGRAGFALAFYKFWYFYTVRLLIKEYADVGCATALNGGGTCTSNGIEQLQAPSCQRRQGRR